MPCTLLQSWEFNSLQGWRWCLPRSGDAQIMCPLYLTTPTPGRRLSQTSSGPPLGHAPCSRCSWTPAAVRRLTEHVLGRLLEALLHASRTGQLWSGGRSSRLMCTLTGIVITNDGNAILREIDVSHPAAKVPRDPLPSRTLASSRACPPPRLLALVPGSEQEEEC